MSVATDAEETVDGDTLEERPVESDGGAPSPAPRAENEKAKVPMSPSRRATLFGLVVVAGLAMLAGWLGFRVYESDKAQQQRSEMLQVARQGALNLTTIDWQHADSDVRRIMVGATGEFYDDFAKLYQPFVDVLKQAKATSAGTITEAALESVSGDTAQALVAVSVQTSTAGESDQSPRAWRMRISLQRLGNQIKVANVGFVQ
jgi:Mce-associated membrane protein